jgi:hypothetical protein
VDPTTQRKPRYEIGGAAAPPLVFELEDLYLTLPTFWVVG